MRIAYLSSSRLPSRFANSVHVVKMCRALSEAGHQVTLHAKRGDGDPLAAYGIDATFDLELVTASQQRVVGPIRFAAATRRRVVALQPELLYARHVWSLVACASLHIPFVYEAHALPRTALHRVVERWLFRHERFRRLVVISDVLRTDYLAAFPSLDPARVVVAHDGADVQPADSTGTESQSRAPRKLQVGYVGHLYPGKGMEIVAALAPRLPHMDFHVVGGTEQDLVRWKRDASFENLRYHGFVSHAELPDKYRMLDVVLVPVQRRVALQRGRGEIGRWTSPLKLFEAMAHRRAMIVSDHPTMLEVVQHGREALVAAAADVDSWVACLQQLERDATLRESLAREALATLEREYTWTQRATRVVGNLAA